METKEDVENKSEIIFMKPDLEKASESLFFAFTRQKTFALNDKAE